jgi:predicted kinase
MPDSVRPLLVFVSGKPGSGKTTLARRLAEPAALGLPALYRDAIKAGLVASHGTETPAVRATIVPRSFGLFFQTIELWLRAGVSLIAEHSLVRQWNEQPVRALIPLTRMVVIRCELPDDIAARRFIARERALQGSGPNQHPPTIERMIQGTFDWRRYDAFDLGVPELRVDTTDGYAPELAAIVAFCLSTYRQC